MLYGDVGTLTAGTGVGGDDQLYGGDGADVLYGDVGLISGGVGDGGNDTLYGGDGGDTLYGDSGFDATDLGMGGYDHLYGGAGNDTLIGDEGIDRLTGGLGLDILTGGEGADFFFVGLGGGGADTITDYSDGVDLIVLTDGLMYGDVQLNQVGADVTLADVTTMEVFAILQNVNVANLMDNDFLTAP